MRTIVIFQRNQHQGVPCGNNGIYSGREIYTRLRRDMRRIRQTAPRHLDLHWYARSLSLDKWDSAVVIRYPESKASGITGPVGRLP
jgi:hypothetical protein